MEVRHFRVILEYDTEDEVWVTHVPTLGHLSTYGETRAEVLEQTREAASGTPTARPRTPSSRRPWRPTSRPVPTGMPPGCEPS